MSGTVPSLASVAHRVTGVDDRAAVVAFRDTVAFDRIVGANDVARR
jgi:hypothetical protein